MFLWKHLNSALRHTFCVLVFTHCKASSITQGFYHTTTRKSENKNYFFLLIEKNQILFLSCCLVESIEIFAWSSYPTAHPVDLRPRTLPLFTYLVIKQSWSVALPFRICVLLSCNLIPRVWQAQPDFLLRNRVRVFTRVCVCICVPFLPRILYIYNWRVSLFPFFRLAVVYSSSSQLLHLALRRV